MISAFFTDFSVNFLIFIGSFLTCYIVFRIFNTILAARKDEKENPN